MIKLLCKKAARDQATATQPSKTGPSGTPNSTRAERTVELARCLRGATSLAQATELRNEIVLLNLGLVNHAMRRLGYNPRYDDDVKSEATCGLIEAAARFDPERNFSFAGYAMLHIRRRMVSWLAASGPWSISESTGRNLHRLRRAIRNLGCGGEVNSGHLAQILGMPVRSVTALRPMVHRPVCIAPAESFCGPATDEEPARVHELLDDLAYLPKALDSLPARERFVLASTFGLDGGPPRHHREVAPILGLTRQRVSQIRDEAIAHLRKAWQANPASGLKAG